ncbi:MAG: hypothetical protein RTU30_15560, partial [Candidatus Thorarchaeota archaeon]
MMRRTTLLLVLAVLMLPTCSLAETSDFSHNGGTQLGTHDIWVEAISAATFHVDCIEGQLLEGHFLIIIDSELY